jgi:hypothetical protein
MPEHNAVMALYPRLVGDAWAELDASVQHWHGAAPQVQGIGLFTIRHGQGGLARFLAWLLRLPAARDGIYAIISHGSPGKAAGRCGWPCFWQRRFSLR